MRVPRGFTITEILVVMSILTVLAGLGFSSATALRNVIAERGARQVESLFLTAAGRAKSGVGGTAWGIYLHYDASTRKASQATVYSGATYASRDASKDAVFPLDGTLRFTTVSLSGSGTSGGADREASFAFQTGVTAQYGTLTVTAYDRSTVINVSPSGTVARPSL